MQKQEQQKNPTKFGFSLMFFFFFFIFFFQILHFPYGLQQRDLALKMINQKIHFSFSSKYLSVCNSLGTHGLRPTRLLCPRDFHAKYTEVGAISSSRVFPSQGFNLCLLCLLSCRQILYPLCHWGSP